MASPTFQFVVIQLFLQMHVWSNTFFVLLIVAMVRRLECSTESNWKSLEVSVVLKKLENLLVCKLWLQKLNPNLISVLTCMRESNCKENIATLGLKVLSMASECEPVLFQEENRGCLSYANVGSRDSTTPMWGQVKRRKFDLRGEHVLGFSACFGYTMEWAQWMWAVCDGNRISFN